MTDSIKVKYAGLEQKYASLTILFAMLLGGGTEQGLWSDHLIQLLIAPLLIIGFVRFPAMEMSRWVKIICVLSILLIALQFIPYSSQLIFPNSTQTVNLEYWSASPSRALEAALYFLTCLGLFVYLSSISIPAKIKILKVILISVLIQCFAVAIQLSFSSRFELLGLLPFKITAGLFANENHFSTMLFSSIPILGFIFMVIRKKTLLFFSLSTLVILLLFAIGSRAGMAFALIQITLTSIWYFSQRLIDPVRFGIFMVGGVISIAAIYFLDFSSVIANDLRGEIFENSINAIKNHWLLGTGLGTFVLLYPSYESLEQISSYYINHVHNDYLELILELGVLVIVPFLIYLILVLKLSFTRKYAGVLGITIIAILAHSILDYPLRTFSVAIIFITTSAILFQKEDKIM